MENYFTVKAKDLENLKNKIRSLDSLRFLANPEEISKNEYKISLSGSVEDFNKLSKYREELKNAN